MDKVCIFALLLILYAMIRQTLYFFFLFLSFGLNAQTSTFDTYFEDNTLNLLCYHSGRKALEFYSIDQTYITKKWAGSKTNLLDNSNLGAHRIEVYAHNSNRLIYSRNYCSLFEEWQTTSEAKNTCGNFEEVLRIPLPKEDADITFFSRDSLGNWYKIVNQKIEVKNAEFKTLNYKLYEPYKLNVSSEDISKKLDIVIVPAGYTQRDSLKMISDMKLFSDFFFSKPPFSDAKEKINIWGQCYFSEQTGIAGLDSTINPNSFLGVSYNTFNSPRYIMTPNLFNLHEILINVPYEQIVIMCNSETYGGGGIFNFYATSYVNPKNGFVLIHEFGHSFAGLGDEYSENDSDVEGATQKIEPWQKNVTSLKDFSKKWKDMIDTTTPIPTPTTLEFEDKVGVFEGAAYVTKGLYRPYQNCLMRSDVPFCPVCTREINKMLDFYCE